MRTSFPHLSTPMPQRRLHLFLVLALLLFSWAEVEHNTDLAAHHDGESCAVCLFASPLGNGATPAALQPLSPQVAHSAPHSLPPAIVLPQPFRHTLGQRGPPSHA
jgi:hypothetical protein